MYNFKGKVAIVTGAAAKQGMGRGIAVALARGGADVAVFDKFEAPPSLYAGDEGWHGLSDVAKEIMSLGRKALAVKADVSNSKEVNDAVQKTLNTLDRIDILVNCAGLVGKRDTRVVDMTDEDWELTRPYLEENARLFGIKIAELLTVDGKLLKPSEVYRKVAPVKVAALGKNSESGNQDSGQEATVGAGESEIRNPKSEIPGKGGR